ncbi:hypothetical protein PFISCL1PPCAC_10821, partial [Pristionchus fissidentatus]
AMSTAPRPQPGGVARPGQAPRVAPRLPQRLLTSNGDHRTPIKVVVPSRKRVTLKVEEEDEGCPPVLTKQHKYQGDTLPRRVSIPSQKAREAANDSYVDGPSSSNYPSDRSYDYGIEEDDYEMYYDKLPPRILNKHTPPRMNRSPYGASPIKVKTEPGVIHRALLLSQPASIVNMGKAVVTGRKEVLSQQIDVQQLIEKYVNADTPKESEAWLINIGLSEKLNSMNRDLERMKNEMSDMKKFVVEHKASRKEALNERDHTQNPWPGHMSGGDVPALFGANPAPTPPNERDYVIPAMYSKNEIDCRDVYNAMQRHGKKRPGVAFLTYYVRELFAIAIQAPHKFVLTIRSRKRNDAFIQMAEEFIKPIEDFFLAACDVTSAHIYSMGGVIREALAHELREIRRNPRKEKIRYIDESKMMNVLKTFGGRGEGMHMDDEDAHHLSVERVEEVEEEEEEHVEMEDEEEEEVHV